ncbi:hypothetical protein ACPPVS_01500 [Cellulomonas sp. McL0617]|uniref:hypothetical protein n=1 Tax=Cellulomonas sp. McL0617 TaxID=3415675 RepID=UPI003CEC387E
MEPEVEHPGDERAVELRRERNTMALYVSICLLAALAAIPTADSSHARVLEIVWGVTLGLALAHWFAFRVATRLVGAGGIGRRDLDLAGAQLTGAVVVAALASAAVLVVPESAELEVTELVLALFVAGVGFVAMRGGGGSRARAALYAAVVLAVAVAVVLVKNALAGH